MIQPETRTQNPIEPTPGNPLRISPELAQKIQEALLEAGLFYVVPPHKYELHKDRRTKTLLLDSTLVEIFKPLIEPGSNQAMLDIEDLSRQVISGSDVGLNIKSAEEIRRGTLAHFSLSSQFSRSQSGRIWLEENLDAGDQARLELDPHLTPQNPIGKGSLVRVDILKQQNGEIVSCDPNIMPLGMAHNYGFSSVLRSETGLDAVQSEIYLEHLRDLARENFGITGILTGLHYPNWSSHMYIAKAVTTRHGLPFFIIPTDCLEEGLINVPNLKAFYKALNLPGISALPGHDRVVPACLIRYAREASHFHPQTRVINPPGVRITESQIWGALASISGFSDCLSEMGIEVSLSSLLKATTPSLLCRLNSHGLEMAVECKVTPAGRFETVWEKAEENLSLFQAAMDQIHSQEKQSERAWYVKSPATTGKKGVRYTNDGSVSKAPSLISKAAKDKASGKIFIVQPKIRSTHLQDGVEKRLKTNLFLSGEHLDFAGADCMLTPISQRAAHGGSETETCLIKVSNT